MAGPDPDVAAARLAVRRCLADLAPGAVVVVACSGGADSLALLDATVFEARAGGWRVLGATVDHGLQPGSDEVAARVVGQMAALGADETTTARVRVEGGPGPEAAARRARHAVLEEVAGRAGAAALLLGHTLDDQAETVLLGLARGSGGRSVAGMRRAYGVVRRPLLDLRRSQLRRACAARGIEPWEDPHNADPAFARVRVRTRVLPVLEAELGPGVTETLARTGEQLRPDMELLDDLAGTAYARCRAAAPGRHREDAPERVETVPTPGPVALDVAALAAEPAPLRTRVLHRAALDAGAPAAELAHGHVVALDALVTGWRGQRWVDLPGHRRGWREGGTLRLGRGA